MFCNLYISKATRNASELDYALTVAAALKIDCNVYDTRSVVDGAIEQGLRFTIFDASPDLLLIFWFDVAIALDLTCAWLESDDYTGCILEWEKYPQD